MRFYVVYTYFFYIVSIKCEMDYHDWFVQRNVILNGIGTGNVSSDRIPRVAATAEIKTNTCKMTVNVSTGSATPVRGNKQISKSVDNYLNFNTSNNCGTKNWTVSKGHDEQDSDEYDRMHFPLVQSEPSHMLRYFTENAPSCDKCRVEMVAKEMEKMCERDAPKFISFMFTDRKTERFESHKKKAMMIGSLRLMYSSLVLSHKCAILLYLYGNDQNVLREVAEPTNAVDVES